MNVMRRVLVVVFWSALMTLAAQGHVKLTTREYRLDQVNEAMHDLIAGRLPGRGVLIP